MTVKEINKEIKKLKNTDNISDGYHTFGELYEHRLELWIALCRNSFSSWRSKKHSDGSIIKGWFILGMYYTEGNQITYHLPNKYWERTDFVEILSKAPKYDGHTSEDVLKRLRKIRKIF